MAESREEKLKGILFREEQQARDWQDAALMRHREESLDYYERNSRAFPFETGQSSIVTSEYADTIESIMPSLMRVFTSGEEVVEFKPDSPDDVQAAQEASDYLPHVMMRENEGFIWFYWFLKDALMYRLSWGAVDIEEVEQTKRKTIQSIPTEAWAILQSEATKMAAQMKAQIDFEVEQNDDGTVSATITTTRKVKKVKVDNIAPEDGLVSPSARHPDEASFLGYRKQVTASELRTLGLEQEEIDDLSSDEIYTAEQSQRQPDVIQSADERSGRDDSERKLWVVVAFVKFDWDDDGISEMRRVLYAHAGGQVSAIIENEEWTDGIAPIIPGTPILMSHAIPGRSVFDLVKDIQQMGTAVARGMLNNMYLVNHPRPAVSDAVDLASLIDWTPGMPIRMRQGQKPTPDNLQWVQVPPVMDKALAVLQWKDEIQQKRTGVTPNNQGVGDDAMNPTATGAALLTSAADQRVELIARVFAETAIKRLFRLIYRAVKRCAAEPITYRSGNGFKTVDPTTWPDDMDLEVNVGLGTNNKQQQLQHLMLVAQGQEKLFQAQGGPEGPLMKMENMANTFRKTLQVVGFKNTDQFVNNDQEIEQGKQQAAQNPKPDPDMAKVQAQSQAKMAEIQANAQSAQAQQQQDAQLAQQKLASDIQLKQQEAAADMQIAREKAALEMQLAREKAALDAQLKREELLLEAGLKREEIASNERTQANIQQQQVGDDE